jgi:ABC-type transport system substrate-binding protein
MTQQTSRSRVLRRVGVALAATVAVSTVASTAGQAASKQSASKYGGDAKVAIFDTLPGFCFADNPANSALMVHRTFYETLFEKTVSGKMVGLLASSATKSSDLKTWTIKLRTGVKFHDGTAFDAAAVKLNLDYATGQAAVAAAATAAATNKEIQAHAAKIYTALSSPQTVSNPLGGTTGAALLAGSGITDTSAAKTTANIGTIAFGVAAGAFADGGNLDKNIIGKGKAGTLDALGLARKADTSFLLAAVGIGTSAAFLSNIAKTEVVNASTVKLTLDRPQNDVPGMLYASGRLVMRGPSQFSGAAAATCSVARPVGTGPFMAPEGYVLPKKFHDEIKVVKNPNYWRKDPKTGDKLPYLDSIQFTNVKEGSQRAAAVRKGTYDAGQFTAAADATFIKDLRKRKSLVTEFKSPSEYYPSLWLNQGKANSPFKSKNARLAVLHCIDRANYTKVRTKGEGTVAKALVGPKSVMYTTSGFQAYSKTLSAKYLADWKKEDPKNTELKFTIPADVSGASQANADFLIKTWKSCGINVDKDVKESGVIIQQAFNSAATSVAEQNAYDAIAILLFEGTDVSFNLPFVLTNAYPTGSTNSAAVLLRNSVGGILGLNKHTDTKVDDYFYKGQASKTSAAATKQFRAGTAYLQKNGYMGSITHFYYTMFVNKKNGLTNIGKVQISKGNTQRIVTNWGIDWSGVQKKG